MHYELYILGGVMKTDNIIVDKSKAFAVRTINLYKYLCNEKKEFVLSKQLLRSGTSIGANVKEAIRGQSKNDFTHKMNISLKEASPWAIKQRMSLGFVLTSFLALRR